MLKNMSLKNKLAILASLAIVIGTIIVELIAFRASLQQLDHSVQQRIQGSAASYNQYVIDWLKAKQSALTSLQSESKEDAIVTHLKQIRDSGGFDNVFLAYPDGAQKNANGVTLPPDNNDPRKWGWYINAMADKSRVFMDNPTVAAATGKNVVSLGKAVDFSGKNLVLGADVEITDIINTMNQVILPGSGFMFIANQKGNVFTHADSKLLNQSVSALGLSFKDIENAAKQSSEIRIQLNGEEYELFARPIKGTSLITVILLNYSSLVSPLYTTLYSQFVVTGVLILVCIAVFNLLCNVLFRPLRHVADALEEIASGSGDLTQRIPVEAHDEVGKLALGFNTFVDKLQQLMLDIRSQAEDLTSQSKLSAERSNASARELGVQQQEVSMVATAVTEMSSATQEIASHAEQTASAAQGSAQTTEDGRNRVMDTKASIDRLAQELQQAGVVVSELDHHAQEISSVLATIQGIAEQTNLLALNAAIEAARAGEQGRGFAVVADEVRVLSQRTHTSTEEIKTTTDKLQEITQRAVSIMDNSSKLAGSSVEDADKAAFALNEISSAVSLISDMATQIATAAEEQTHVTEEITLNITSIRDVTEQLAVGSDESLQQSNDLRNSAHSLSEKVATFKLS
ncbi:methyl-accepting chemotaxis protein [Vibrio viridaestus]|uniref:Methyl-accepting chemotaxis protein n=1 Tax=Vibrio viridaestus TaxID=2487322 RepID=A0A3N9U5F5_9VIBR|nr:methyl-accepting chemotaxis protein [Vibrio viridaestus]RQW64932.1 methyl-accepting chemotaxis protein [Vibrio viridaestus]